MFKFYDQAEWKAFAEKMQSIRKDISQLKAEQTQHLSRITDLGVAQDAMRFKYDILETDSKTDKTLFEYTGESGECWYYKYDICSDEIRDLRISKAQQVSSIQEKITILNLEYSVLDIQQDECRDRLIYDHEEKERKASQLIETNKSKSTKKPTKSGSV